MKQMFVIFFYGFLVTLRVYAQCDMPNREKAIFAALNFFQDSINRAKPNILLIDSTQMTGYPNCSLDPDFFKFLPDTSLVADLLTGFKQTFQLKVGLTTLGTCSRITMTTKKAISQILKKGEGWKTFYKIYPNNLGYYTTTEPFLIDNHAIIYVENFCGNLCGSGYILFLQYTQDLKEWRVFYSKQVWVS